MGRTNSPDIALVLDKVLTHHGIKGQHWGVRRNRTQISADAQRVHDVRQVHKRSGKSALSNADLQAFITRKGLEKQFDQFTPSGQVKTFVSDFMKSEGKQQIKSFAKDQITKQAKRTVTGS